MTIAREGLKFIIPAAGLAALFWALAFWPAMALFVLLAAAFAFFFRDPRRIPPQGEHLLVSPADGRILAVDALPSHPDIPGPVSRVTVFLSLYDVHLVRSPLTATVARMDYNPGKFLPAYKPEAGSVNESRTLVMRSGKADLVMKMIVGVAARRIKSYVHEGDAVVRGRKIGLMYFGSRVEIFLPRNVTISAAPGRKVKGGESVIAEVRP